MPTLSTTYAPGSVTTETPALESSSFDLQSNAPDMSFLQEIMRRKVEQEAKRRSEEAKLRAAAEKRAQEAHDFQMYQGRRGDQFATQQAQTANRLQAMSEREAREQIPDKWVYDMVPTGYGHMKVASLNPEYERWANKRGKFDVGPSNVSIMPTIQPGSTASEGAGRDLAEFESVNKYLKDLSKPKDDNERPDWFGTGGV